MIIFDLTKDIGICKIAASKINMSNVTDPPLPPHHYSLQGSDNVAGAGEAEEGSTWVCIIVPFLTQLTAVPPSVVGAALQDKDHISHFIISPNDTSLIPRPHLGIHHLHGNEAKLKQTSTFN